MAPYHRLPRTPVVDRDTYLVDRCRRRRVLHLACGAWPFTEQLARDGRLLHGKLLSSCESLAGVDVVAQAVQWLKSHGYQDVYQADLLDGVQLQKVIGQLKWVPDVLIAGEILEHVANVGQFLTNCRQAMSLRTELLITVPNAFALRGICHVLRGREKVSADHVAYYSWSTIRSLLTHSGLEITDVQWYRAAAAPRGFDELVETILSPVYWIWPYLADGLIVVCRRLGN